MHFFTSFSEKNKNRKNDLKERLKLFNYVIFYVSNLKKIISAVFLSLLALSKYL